MKYLIFRAGNYPQGSVTIDDVKAIALNYDRNYHEAPLTVNHQDDPIFGIVSNLSASDSGELFAEFDELDQWIIEQTQIGKYRKPSIEIADYTDKGKYLRAVTLTNFPAVKNLPRIMFSDSDGKEKEAMIFSDSNISIKFNNNNMDLLKKFADKIKIVFADNIPETAEELVDKLFALIAEFKARQESSEQEMQDLKSKIQKYEQEKFDELIAKAKTKIKDISAFEVLAKSNFNEAAKLLDSIPEPKLFEQNKTKSTTPKNDNDITYEKILSDLSLAEKFSEDEINNLRKKFIEKFK